MRLVDAPSDRALRRAEHRSFRLLQKRRRVLVRKEARIASEVSRRNRVREGRAPWMCVVHARMQLCAMVSLRSRTVTHPPPPPPPYTHTHTRIHAHWCVHRLCISRAFSLQVRRRAADARRSWSSNRCCAAMALTHR